MNTKPVIYCNIQAEFYHRTLQYMGHKCCLVSSHSSLTSQLLLMKDDGWWTLESGEREKAGEMDQVGI